MKKKHRYVLVILISGLVFCCLFCFSYVQFLSNTVDNEHLDEYCYERSERHSQDYIIELSSQYDGYLFYVAADKNEGKGQELFIFKSADFLSFPTPRLVEYYRTVGAEYPLPVSALAMTFTQENGEKYDTGNMIFYSANEAGISEVRYTVYENGQQRNERQYFEPSKGFCHVINNLEMKPDADKNRYIEASFYNETGEKIYSNTYIY